MSSRDIGASVRQRLLNRAREKNRPFQEILQYFAMERFLYRLATSGFSDLFVLKGALLLVAWRAPFERPTIDIDLAGKTSNELGHIAKLIGDVCDAVAEPDGLKFDRTSIETRRIKEDAEYEGVRVRFRATLARAVIPMQIDIGFGDVIVPAPATVTFPVLLDFPAPVLRAYSKEAVIAEKLEAMVVLGLLNSRLKDYYDIALLSRMYAFEGQTLSEAIRATFQHRGTQIQSEVAGLSDAFSDDPARLIQWRAFLRRSRFDEEQADLKRLLKEVRHFGLPILNALANSRVFDARWAAGGPWQ